MNNVFIYMMQDLRGEVFSKVYTRRSISLSNISICKGVVTFRLKGGWEIKHFAGCLFIAIAIAFFK